MGSHLARTLPHVLHVGVGDVRVGGGQRVVQLLGGVDAQQQHQGLVGQRLKRRTEAAEVTFRAWRNFREEKDALGSTQAHARTHTKKV